MVVCRIRIIERHGVIYRAAKPQLYNLRCFYILMCRSFVISGCGVLTIIHSLIGGIRATAGGVGIMRRILLLRAASTTPNS